MSPIGVTWGRTIGRSRSQYSTALAIGGFLAIVATTFAFLLWKGEGGLFSLPTVWAASVAPLLPALIAFLAMDVWSDERQTGRIDVLLSTAVRERDYVFGKFLGVWSFSMAVVLFFWAVSVVALAVVSPVTMEPVRMSSFLPAFCILFVQGAMWSAASIALSAMFYHAAAAACSSIVLLIAIPRGIWLALVEWAGDYRPQLGEMPFDAHVIDMASGIVSPGVLLSYLILTVAMLFVASKRVSTLRAVGRGGRSYRFSAAAAILLSLVASMLAIVLAMRLNRTVDLPSVGVAPAFSPRTRDILAETGGNLSAVAYLPRSDARFRSVAQFLRALKRESAAAGVSGFDISFVDPHWDLGAAERLARNGVTENCIVFVKGYRMSIMPIADGCDERTCAAALRRLFAPPQRRNVYWTTGHGEFSSGEYGAFGMSDIARDLAREGYVNATIDLTSNKPVPGDCALIVVAGPRDDLSRAELDRLEAYLRENGRLLVLCGSDRQNGIASLLTSWGMRPVRQPIVGAKTLNGSDVAVSEFADHAVSSPLKGSRIVMEDPLVFLPSAVAGIGADRLNVVPIASVGSAAVVVCAERGVGAGQDSIVRPTRIVAIGDALFATNGSLATRGNANRDFFMNAIAFLSGTDFVGSSGNKGVSLNVIMDRTTRMKYVAVTAVGMPGAVFILLLFAAYKRKHRE